MKHRIRISLGSVWETTVGFVRAESALLAPLALLGFGMPVVAMLLAVPMEAAASETLKPGPWMLWLLPCGLVSMLGSIAVSALVLTPGVSVRESIMVAIRRFPTAIGLLILYVGVQVGCYARLLALRIVMAVAAVIAMLVLLIPIGAVAQLIGMATGNPQVSVILSFVATGVVVAAVVGLWTVYVARLYRALEAATDDPISGI